MTWWKYIILGLTAFGGGSVISAAVFALIASTGVITRMAGKNHTGNMLLNMRQQLWQEVHCGIYSGYFP